MRSKSSNTQHSSRGYGLSLNMYQFNKMLDTVLRLHMLVLGAYVYLLVIYPGYHLLIKSRIIQFPIRQNSVYPVSPTGQPVNRSYGGTHISLYALIKPFKSNLYVTPAAEGLDMAYNCNILYTAPHSNSPHPLFQPPRFQV